MKRTAGVLSVASLVVLAGQAAGQTCVFPPIGPDVIVGVRNPYVEPIDSQTLQQKLDMMRWYSENVLSKA